LRRIPCGRFSISSDWTRRIFHRLSRSRAEELEVAIPGECWEVKFFTDGTVETEGARLDELLALGA